MAIVRLIGADLLELIEIILNGKVFALQNSCTYYMMMYHSIVD